MGKLDAIKEQLEALTPDEAAEFRDWLADRETDVGEQSLLTDEQEEIVLSRLSEPREYATAGEIDAVFNKYGKVR